MGNQSWQGPRNGLRVGTDTCWVRGRGSAGRGTRGGGGGGGRWNNAERETSGSPVLRTRGL